MYIDVAELWDFYKRPLGHTVRRLLGGRLRSYWRHVEGETVIGLGYATPLLGSFRGEARRLGALMPVGQGAMVWPATGDSMTALVDAEALPLPNGTVDRLIVLHCLEHVERVQPVLREFTRVLSDQGRLMLIVPNRSGVWARVDRTPFGFGRPFSRQQLENLTREANLEPVACHFALHMPPVDKSLVLRSAVAFERVGARIWPGVAGVMMLEATRHRGPVMAPTAKAPALGELVRLPIVRPAGARIGGVSPGALLEHEHGLFAENVLQPERPVDRQSPAGRVERDGLLHVGADDGDEVNEIGDRAQV